MGWRTHRKELVAAIHVAMPCNVLPTTLCRRHRDKMFDLCPRRAFAITWDSDIA